MPSWQSYLVHPLLRLLVQRRLAKVSTPLEARAILEASSTTKPPGAIFSHGQEGGIEGEWACGTTPCSGTILYLHGGGYFACSPAHYHPITGGFAQEGFKVFAPAYRLAPEHPFPAALEDALAAYRSLLTTHAAHELMIVGDSAGGGLAMSLMLAAREAGLPLPAGGILFSPWTDLAITGASITTNSLRESLLIGERLAEAAALYLNGVDPHTPLASPLYGDLSGLPPLLIQASEREILRDDSTRLAARIQALGGTVELSVWPNLPHAWQLAQAFLPEARDALHKAAIFAKTALASRCSAS